MPADLVSLLRDHSVVVPQDAAVFELIAAWRRRVIADNGVTLPLANALANEQ